jgi:hypothetical protein
MTLAKAKARANETFRVQASLTIFTYDLTYDHQNIFIVQATVLGSKAVSVMVLFVAA